MTTSNKGSPLIKLRDTHRKLFDEITDSQIAQMKALNDRIAQVKVSGKLRYIDRNDRELVYYSREDMADILAHETVLILSERTVDKRRVPISKAVPAFRWWLTQHDRRTYGEVVFVPYRPNGKPQGVGDDALNLFQGFAVKPAFTGKPYSLFKAHVEQNICGGDAAMIEFVWDFAADIFQNPAKRPGVALILRGAKGVGKSVFSEVIAAMIGDRYCHVIDSTEGLVGRFGGHLEGKMLLQVEEAYHAGNPAHESKLKSLITSRRLPVERKGVDTYMAPAYFRIIITSNADHVIPATSGERRFVVLDVKPTRKQDGRHFEAMRKELEGGGYAALMADLMKRPLGNRDFSKPPASAALSDQIRLSMKPDERWWSSLLVTGMLAFERTPDDLDADTEWPLTETLTIERRHLLTSFQQMVRDHRGSQTPEALGRFLRKVAGETIGSIKATLPHRGRANCYVLPPRGEALATFLALHPGLMLTADDAMVDEVVDGSEDRRAVVVEDAQSVPAVVTLDEHRPSRRRTFN